MVGYLDSSLALAAILEKDTSILQARRVGPLFSSELLTIECRRAILRERSTGVFDDDAFLDALDHLGEILAGLQLVDLDHAIKTRAQEAFPVHVKTLDALHLSTALAVAEAYPEDSVVVFSLDGAMNRAARALGLAAPFST